MPKGGYYDILNTLDSNLENNETSRANTRKSKRPRSPVVGAGIFMDKSRPAHPVSLDGTLALLERLDDQLIRMRKHILPTEKQIKHYDAFMPLALGAAMITFLGLSYVLERACAGTGYIEASDLGYIVRSNVTHCASRIFPSESAAEHYKQNLGMDGIGFLISMVSSHVVAMMLSMGVDGGIDNVVRNAPSFVRLESEEADLNQMVKILEILKKQSCGEPAREYYGLHASLMELKSNPKGILWLEQIKSVRRGLFNLQGRILGGEIPQDKQEALAELEADFLAHAVPVRR